MSSSAEKLWEPSPERIERATMTRYMRWLEHERGLEFGSYEGLWRWSVDELEDFWRSIWEFFDVRSSGSPEQVLAERVMPGARWFEGAELNYAEHIFRDRDPDAVAVHHASELRELAELTWGELERQVAAVAAGLRERGVERGDRVVAYVPNTPEALVAFLATASIGAVWSSCSPDFGASSVVDRFAQIEPKVLICVDGYRYGGKDFDRLETVAGLQAQMPTLEATVVIPYLDPEADLTALDGATRWDDLLTSGGDHALTFERVPFDHPLWVLYSSGTTGLPKAIVQGQGGILLEHLKKLNLHVDAQEGDRIFWFTTTGWMMWNFLVSALLTPASIVLYDGNPGHPDMGVLWDLAERAGVTCFGTSASYVAACMKAGIEPGDGSRPLPARRDRLDRVPARARGLRMDLRARRRGHLAVLDLGRHRRLHRLRRRGTAPARLPRRAAGPRARRGRRVLGRGGAPADRRGRRAGPDRADALDAGLLLGRRRRLEAPRGLLRALPGRLAPRRLDRDHRARHRDHLRALGLDHQPPGRADGDERDLPRGRWPSPRCSTRWSSTSPAQVPRGGCHCSWSCARARS